MNKSVENIIESCGRSMSISRIYIIEPAAYNTVRKTFEWCNDGITSLLTRFPCYDQGIYNYKNITSAPDVYALQLCNADSMISEFLTLQGIKTQFTLPLCHHDNVWGYICFDYCQEEHILSSTETIKLRNVCQELSGLRWGEDDLTTPSDTPAAPIV